MAEANETTPSTGQEPANLNEPTAEDLAREDEELARRIAEEQAAEAVGEGEEDEGPRDWQRFYMGYHERFVDDCVLELRGGRVQVRLAQAPSAKCSAKRHGGKQLDKASDPALTGTTVWDGAVVLSHYLAETSALARPPDSPFPYSGTPLPSVLELGAGTGAVSLALAATRAAANVTTTDLPDLLPHLKVNVSRNSGVLPPGRLNLAPLRWGPEGEPDVQRLAPAGPPYDVIVGSDLIYYTYTPETPHSELLLWTLRRLAGPHTTVFLSLSLHHNPEEVEHFLGWAAEHFHVLRLKRSIPPEWRVHDSLVVRLTPRRRPGAVWGGKPGGGGGGVVGAAGAAAAAGTAGAAAAGANGSAVEG